MTTTLYYDFRFGGTNAGYFAISDDDSEIYQCATFEVDGERHENTFCLRYRGKRILAYKTGNRRWIDISALSQDHYPTSAYPVLIRNGICSYVALNESTGEILGWTALEKSGDAIVEIREGNVTREFTVKDDRIIRIDWGGAVSILRESKMAAITSVRLTPSLSIISYWYSVSSEDFKV